MPTYHPRQSNGKAMSTAKVICLYSTEQHDAAMELAARMLKLKTHRRGAAGNTDVVGNKSALVKAMTAAALEAAIFSCDDPVLVAQAKAMLKSVDVVIEDDDGRLSRLSTRVDKLIPQVVGDKVTVPPRYRYVPAKDKPGYERKVVL